MQVSSFENEKAPVFERRSVDIKDFKRFNETLETFDRQFSSTYIARLKILHDRVVQKIKSKWGSQYPILEVVELAEKNIDETCILIGTLYKHQELKPSVLKNISEELQLTVQPQRSNYCSLNDCLYLEDNVQRVKLIGNYGVNEVVTGIVCAALGHDLKNGTFWVDDWCFPGCLPHISNSNLLSKNKGKILFISGLDFAHCADSVTLNILQEWITGMAGNEAEQKKTSHLVTIIIAGNSVKGSTEIFTRDNYFEKNSNSTPVTDAILSVRRFDSFLNQIVKICHVVLMPGEFDPSCHMIPQRPLHPQILPKSSRFDSLHGVTNPWIGSIGSRIVAGSSGQPILDIMKVSNLKNASPLIWLEKTLTWQHFAPTSPDTLDAYPYFNRDPFVMEECPDIYFVGNVEKYDTKLLTGDEGQCVRLICIPKFSESQTTILVDLETLDVLPISFGTD